MRSMIVSVRDSSASGFSPVLSSRVSRAHLSDMRTAMPRGTGMPSVSAFWKFAIGSAFPAYPSFLATAMSMQELKVHSMWLRRGLSSIVPAILSAIFDLRCRGLRGWARETVRGLVRTRCPSPSRTRGKTRHGAGVRSARQQIDLYAFRARNEHQRSPVRRWGTAPKASSPDTSGPGYCHSGRPKWQNQVVYAGQLTVPAFSRAGTPPQAMPMRAASTRSRRNPQALGALHDELVQARRRLRFQMPTHPTTVDVVSIFDDAAVSTDGREDERDDTLRLPPRPLDTPCVVATMRTGPSRVPGCGLGFDAVPVGHAGTFHHAGFDTST